MGPTTVAEVPTDQVRDLNEQDWFELPGVMHHLFLTPVILGALLRLLNWSATGQAAEDGI